MWEADCSQTAVDDVDECFSSACWMGRRSAAIGSQIASVCAGGSCSGADLPVARQPEHVLGRLRVVGPGGSAAGGDEAPVAELDATGGAKHSLVTASFKGQA